MEIARRNVTDEKLTYRHIHDDKESDEDGQRKTTIKTSVRIKSGEFKLHCT